MRVFICLFQCIRLFICVFSFVYFSVFVCLYACFHLFISVYSFVYMRVFICLFQCIRLLDEEEKSDTQLKEQFKERWTRTSSANLTKPMREESGKYKNILDTAIGADRIVQEKYNVHKTAVVLLSKPTVSIDYRQK